jgi:hypothetical protein
MELPAFSEFFAAYEVKVQVGDFLSAVCAGVDKNPIAAFGNPELTGQLLHYLEDFTNQWLIVGLHFICGHNMLSRDNQNMHRRDRIDILESHKIIVFKNKVCGNFSTDNLTEDAFHSLLLFP